MAELALTPDRKWNAATAELVSLCAAAGFTGLGIAADRVDAAAVSSYRDAGLRCHELLVLWVDGGPEATLASAERLTSAAEQIGAEWVLTAFAGEASSEIVRAIAQAAAMFDEVGCGMAVEFTPLSPVATIHDGMEVVRLARGSGRAGLMIDTWHFTLGASTWADLATVPIDDIAYVQFNDIRAPEPGSSLMRETLNRRAVPGEGTADLERFATTLRDRGWDGTVSVEVLDAHLRTRPLPEIVQTLHDASAPFWR